MATKKLCGYKKQWDSFMSDSVAADLQLQIAALQVRLQESEKADDRSFWRCLHTSFAIPWLPLPVPSQC